MKFPPLFVEVDATQIDTATTKLEHLLELQKQVNAPKKEQPYITINGKDYSMINVTDSHGGLIASISSEGIIEAFDAHVDLIKDSSKVRFSDVPD